VGWHREDKVRGLVLKYYVVLRSVLRSKPHLRRCLKRCRHCRIFFLTHPCNAGRKDLRCPFGCRDAHRKHDSHTRTTAYYRTHPDEKRRHNRNRYLVDRKADGEDEESRARRTVEARNGPITDHIRMVVCLIEARRVSRDEIGRMLNRISRQHSLWRRRRMDYVVRQLNRGPPER